jgi:hypothetical protein
LGGWELEVTVGFFVYTRYGARLDCEDDADPEQVVPSLIEELRAERFEEPDDEHTEVSVNIADWGLSAKVSGLVTLSDTSWITGSPSDAPKNARHMMDDLHMRDIPDQELILLMCELARGNIDRVRAAPWRSYEQLPRFVRDYYRRAP